MEFASPEIQSPADPVWSMVLSQLARCSHPQQAEPVRPRPPVARRFDVRVEARPGKGTPQEARNDPAVFDALSCILVVCRRIGLPAQVRSDDEALPRLSFMTAHSAASVQRQLANVLAECNTRLRESPWKIVATNKNLH